MKNTKSQVLSMLNSEYVSGEYISQKLGVSRAAVNSAVASLRTEGYVIEAVTKKGYRLVSSPDSLDVCALSRYVQQAEERIVTHESVVSTNIILKQLAAEGAKHGTVVLAEEQTGGRGRFGKSFISPKYSGIYLSYLIKPERKIKDFYFLTARVAMLVRGVIQEFLPQKQIGIKWVNDIIIDEKKVCGILTELSVEAESGNVAYAVIGIGINVNTDISCFPADIQPFVGSLKSVSGQKINRVELASKIIKCLDGLAENLFVSPDFYKEYAKYCVTVGRLVRFCINEKEHIGTAVSINPDFSLNIQTEDGIYTVSSGEVSVRGLLGYIG